MSPGNNDNYYMGHAIKLARKGLYTTHPNPRVGCVVVKDGKIVGEAWHDMAGQPHAEVLALRQSGESARGASVLCQSGNRVCHQGTHAHRAPAFSSMPESRAWWPPWRIPIHKSPGEGYRI